MMDWEWGAPRSQDQLLRSLSPEEVLWFRKKFQEKNTKRTGFTRRLHARADSLLLKQLELGETFYVASMKAVSKLSFEGAIALFIVLVAWLVGFAAVLALLAAWSMTVYWIVTCWAFALFCLYPTLNRVFFRPKPPKEPCTHPNPEEVIEVVAGQPTCWVVCSVCGARL